MGARDAPYGRRIGMQCRGENSKISLDKLDGDVRAGDSHHGPLFENGVPKPKVVGSTSAGCRLLDCILISYTVRRMQWDATKITGFDWDAGNQTKSVAKHAVSCDEAEQLFLNAPLKVLADPEHSETEPRLHAFGKTDEGRHLTIAFTIRGSRIRIISARPMNKKEKKIYEKE